jgi:hypothetical protein
MVELGDVFHLEAPRMKHEENSHAGILEAIRTGCDSIDIDMSRCKNKRGIPGAGRAYGNHWPHPMERDGFTDPLHRMPHDKRFADMTPGQVERMHTPDGFVIRPIVDLLEFSSRHRTHAGKPLAWRLECKPGYLWSVKFFISLRETVDKHGVPVVIATMDSYNSWRETLDNARRAGFRDTRKLSA